eukprot:2502577-Rhodomonas_salina.2
MQLVLVHYALYCFAFLLVQERGTESGGRWYQLPEMYRGQQSEMPPWLQRSTDDVVPALWCTAVECYGCTAVVCCGCYTTTRYCVATDATVPR